MNMECYDDNGNMCGFIYADWRISSVEHQLLLFYLRKIRSSANDSSLSRVLSINKMNQLSQTFFDSKTDDATIAILLQIPAKQVSNFTLHTYILSIPSFRPKWNVIISIDACMHACMQKLATD